MITDKAIEDLEAGAAGLAEEIKQRAGNYSSSRHELGNSIEQLEKVLILISACGKLNKDMGSGDYDVRTMTYDDIIQYVMNNPSLTESMVSAFAEAAGEDHAEEQIQP